MQIYVLISVLANYFHFGNSCLFVQFALIIYCTRACVRNKPRAFFHFCIFRAGRQPSKKGALAYIEWHTLAIIERYFGFHRVPH